MNLYTYVENNPLRYVDRTGHHKEDSGVATGAGVGPVSASDGGAAVSGEVMSSVDSAVKGPTIEELDADVAKIYERLALEEAEEASLASGDNIEARERAAKSETTITNYNPQYAAQQMLNNGRVSIENLENMVPDGATNGFRPSATITDGYKYNYNINGTKVEIKWHSPDANAASRFPGSNSGEGWTAQIKIGNKLLGQDGNFYRNPSNITHIPVDLRR